jgi:hypothetical protein
MIEHNRQFDDSEPHVPDRLRQDLHGLFQPPGAVPARVDRAILDQAHRRLAKPQHLIICLRWAAGIATAAAVVTLGVILLNVVTPDSDPGPQSRLPRFARNDMIRNPQSSRPALAEGRADIDGNGRVDILDAFRLARDIEARGPADPMHSSATDLQWDLNGDGRVDKDDVDVVASAAVRLGPQTGGTVAKRDEARLGSLTAALGGARNPAGSGWATNGLRGTGV